MTFEGQYLTYAEFIQLGGSAIGEMPFNILEFEARRQIDLRTFNRIQKCESVPQEAKICEYNLINSISEYVEATHSITNAGNIKSESIDGYSIQYISASEVSDVVRSKKEEIDDIVRTYFINLIIDGEHAMYCGADKC